MTTESLKAAGLYPLADRLPLLDCLALLNDHDLARRATHFGVFNDPVSGRAFRIFATPTGEYREPADGEWFLSGAKIEAYRATNTLHNPHHIAKLVLTELKWEVVS